MSERMPRWVSDALNAIVALDKTPTCDSCGGDPETGSAFCAGCAADYEMRQLGEYARRGWAG